jgi:hypothetical protein
MEAGIFIGAAIAVGWAIAKGLSSGYRAARCSGIEQRVVLAGLESAFGRL